MDWLSVRMAEWLLSPPLDQHVDLEDLVSNPRTGKLDSGSLYARLLFNSPAIHQHAPVIADCRRQAQIVVKLRRRQRHEQVVTSAVAQRTR